MSELVMTVLAGPSHPNSGDLTAVHVFGGLYVGGSGAWRFGRVDNNGAPRDDIEPIVLDSGLAHMAEIRAGVTLTLGLGAAREIVEVHAGPDWRQLRLELPPAILNRIGDEGRGKGVGLLISTIDDAMAKTSLPDLANGGWSIRLCGPKAEHLETQWD
jgi:hypothetical protein